MTNPLRDRVLGADGNFIEPMNDSYVKNTKGELYHRVMLLEKKVKEYKRGGDKVKNKEFEDMKQSYNQTLAENRLFKDKLKEFEIKTPRLEKLKEELEVQLRNSASEIKAAQREVQTANNTEWKKKFEKAEGRIKQMEKEYVELSDEVILLRK